MVGTPGNNKTFHCDVKKSIRQELSVYNSYSVLFFLMQNKACNKRDKTSVH